MVEVLEHAGLRRGLARNVRYSVPQILANDVRMQSLACSQAPFTAPSIAETNRDRQSAALEHRTDGFLADGSSLNVLTTSHITATCCHCTNERASAFHKEAMAKLMPQRTV